MPPGRWRRCAPAWRPGTEPVRRLCQGLGGVAAALVLVMMAVTVIDVAGRYLVSAPLPGAFEVTEVVLAVVIFLGLPLVCLDDGHVSVPLLTDRLPPAGRRVQAGVVALLGAVVLGVVAWRLAAHGMQLARYGDVTVFLRLPTGPIAWLLAGLTAVAAVVLVGRGIRILGTPAADAGKE